MVVVIIHETLIIWIWYGKVFKHCVLARQRKMDTNWSLSKLSWSLICPCSYNSVKHWFYIINYSDSEITNVHERRWLELKLKILRSVYTCNTFSSTVLLCSRTCIYIYIAMLTFWLSNAWHPSFIYRYSNSYSWLNYYCTELLSDSDIIFIHLLVPKNIQHTCYISNEWTLWWINFLDCATLHGCTVYIYCL